MKIFLMPQVSEHPNFKYSMEGDILNVECDGVMDEFDFSSFPNGQLEIMDNEGNRLMETVLEVNPILKGERREGILYLTLLNRIGENESYEVRFPEWIDAKDYVYTEPEMAVEPEEVDINGKD